MSIVFLIMGVTIVASAVAVGLFMIGVVAYRAGRDMYYRTTGKIDPTRIYEVKYRIAGDFTVQVRAENAEEAIRKTEHYFEYEERFGQLENPERVSVVAVAEDEKVPATPEV